jgi:hypothetical protein
MTLTVDNLLEVTIAHEDDFLKIKETLTRIGIASREKQTLYQSCHIFHKKGKYYITHFKEMFALDGKATNYSDEDKERRNTIAHLLEEWGLLKIADKTLVEKRAPLSHIKVLPFKEKKDWTLVSKYQVGKKK